MRPDGPARQPAYSVRVGTPMPTVRIDIPALIQRSIGQPALTIDGATTLADALRRASQHPQAGPLLFDERGQLRERLLLLHNGKLARTLPMASSPTAPLDTIVLSERDEIEIVMSVWGG
jgi:sulfur carrier protein ThiS